MLTAKIVLEAVLDRPNRHLLQELLVLFFQFFCCDSKFSFYLLLKHLKNPLRSLPSQPVLLTWSGKSSPAALHFLSLDAVQYYASLHQGIFIAHFCHTEGWYWFTLLLSQCWTSWHYPTMYKNKTSWVTAGKTWESHHKKKPDLLTTKDNRQLG